MPGSRRRRWLPAGVLAAALTTGCGSVSPGTAGGPAPGAAPSTTPTSPSAAPTSQAAASTSQASSPQPTATCTVAPVQTGVQDGAPYEQEQCRVPGTPYDCTQALDRALGRRAAPAAGLRSGEQPVDPVPSGWGRSTPLDGTVGGLVRGPQTWVAAVSAHGGGGGSGWLMTSPDGLTWHRVLDTPERHVGSLQAFTQLLVTPAGFVAYENGTGASALWAAGPSGRDWRQVPGKPVDGNVVAVAGGFLAVQDETGHRTWAARDALTWREVTPLPAAADEHVLLVRSTGDAVLVVTAPDGPADRSGRATAGPRTWWTTTDGTSWRRHPDTAGVFASATWLLPTHGSQEVSTLLTGGGRGLWLLGETTDGPQAQDAGDVAPSPCPVTALWRSTDDGESWARVPVELRDFDQGQLGDIVWAHDRLIGVGAPQGPNASDRTAQVWQSRDGHHWRPLVDAAPRVEYGQGADAAVAGGGRLLVLDGRGGGGPTTIDRVLSRPLPLP